MEYPSQVTQKPKREKQLKNTKLVRRFFWFGPLNEYIKHYYGLDELERKK